jgi:hypothetical protein
LAFVGKKMTMLLMDLTPEKKAQLLRIAPLGGHARAADYGPEGMRQQQLDSYAKRDADGQLTRKVSKRFTNFWRKLRSDPERHREFCDARGRVKTLNSQRKAVGLKPLYGKQAQAMLKQLASFQANKALRKAAASANSKTTEAA